MEPGSPDESAPPRMASAARWPVPLVLALAALGLLGLALLFLFDPARHALYPVCLFKKMTGCDCPGCGGLRAVHQLLRGDVAQALRLNAMVVAAVPALAFLLIRARLHSRRRNPPRRGFAVVGWVWLLAAVVVLFGIVRNLPFWPFGVTPM